MNMELMALRWLRYEKKCLIVMRERSPRIWYCGRPDVLGVTNAAFLIEIEIKRSVSDFKADFEKRCRCNRNLFMDLAPRQFYYFVSPDIFDRVKPFLPPWAGLMTIAENEVYLRVDVVAPTNKASRKLTFRECAKLACSMSNYVLATEEKLENFRNGFRYGHRPWHLDFEI